MYNPNFLAYQLQTYAVLCQECSQIGAAGGDHRNTVRPARLNEKHKVTIVPAGSDPSCCLPRSPCCFGTVFFFFFVEVTTPSVTIPINIKCIQNYCRTFAYTVGLSFMLSHNTRTICPCVSLHSFLI